MKRYRVYHTNGYYANIEALNTINALRQFDKSEIDVFATGIVEFSNKGKTHGIPIKYQLHNLFKVNSRVECNKLLRLVKGIPHGIIDIKDDISYECLKKIQIDESLWYSNYPGALLDIGRNVFIQF
jgi:hypothetical protein